MADKIRTFNQMDKNYASSKYSTSGTAHPVDLVEYDAVPVEYLPPRQRRAL